MNLPVYLALLQNDKETDRKTSFPFLFCVFIQYLVNRELCSFVIVSPSDFKVD